MLLSLLEHKRETSEYINERHATATEAKPLSLWVGYMNPFSPLSYLMLVKFDIIFETCKTKLCTKTNELNL